MRSNTATHRGAWPWQLRIRRRSLRLRYACPRDAEARRYRSGRSLAQAAAGRPRTPAERRPHHQRDDRPHTPCLPPSALSGGVSFCVRIPSGSPLVVVRAAELDHLAGEPVEHSWRPTAVVDSQRGSGPDVLGLWKHPDGCGPARCGPPPWVEGVRDDAMEVRAECDGNRVDCPRFVQKKIGARSDRDLLERPEIHRREDDRRAHGRPFGDGLTFGPRVHRSACRGVQKWLQLDVVQASPLLDRAASDRVLPHLSPRNQQRPCQKRERAWDDSRLRFEQTMTCIESRLKDLLLERLTPDDLRNEEVAQLG